MKTFDEVDYRKNQYKLLLGISVLVFLVILVFTIFYFVDYNKNYGYFKGVTANVIEYEEKDGQSYAVIEYIVGDTAYQKTTHYTNKKIGSKTKVFYDENNPIGIIYDRDIRYYLLPTLNILFAGADITLFVFYFQHYKNKEIKENVVIENNKRVKKFSKQIDSKGKDITDDADKRKVNVNKGKAITSKNDIKSKRTNR